MTIKGYYHGNSTYDAIDLRRAQNERYTAGVLRSTDFAGTVQSTTTFRLAPGSAVIEYDGSGKFSAYSDANEDVTLTAGSGVKRRYLVYLRLRDIENADATDSVSVQTTYTEHATAPTLPTTTDEHLPLYDITINSGATLLTGTTVINDLRQMSRPIGMPVRDDLFFYDTVANGAATSTTKFGDHSDLFTAPVDLRMILTLTGHVGMTFATMDNAPIVNIGVYDTAGSLAGFGPNAESRVCRTISPSDTWAAISLQTYLDINAGQPVGFELWYNIAAASTTIRCTSRVQFMAR